MKIAGEAIEMVAYDPASGLRLTTTNYEVFVPAHCIKASWRRPR